MDRFNRVLSVVALALMIAVVPVVVLAGEIKEKKEGYYTVVEGLVSQINALMLVIDGQQYPLSGFARIYLGSLNGQEISMQSIAGIGKIDKARIYLLGGRVEKIVVLKNI
jgi:FlaG/FlaF family flagellin (archaellin)